MSELQVAGHTKFFTTYLLVPPQDIQLIKQICYNLKKFSPVASEIVLEDKRFRRIYSSIKKFILPNEPQFIANLIASPQTSPELTSKILDAWIQEEKSISAQEV